MKIRRKYYGVGLVVSGAALAAFAAMPAYADTGSATLVGSGTISPGLTTTATFQTFTFGGTAAVVDASNTSASGSYSCSVSGSSSVAETSATGAGSFSGGCSGPTSISASGSYQRDGAAVTLSGSLSGGASGAFKGQCAFVPTSAPTVTSYRVACEIEIT